MQEVGCMVALSVNALQSYGICSSMRSTPKIRPDKEHAKHRFEGFPLLRYPFATRSSKTQDYQNSCWDR